MVKNGQGLNAAIPGIAQIDVRVGLQLPCIAALTTNNHRDARRIQRNGKGNGIVLLARPQCLRRQNHNLVGICDSGQMGLGSIHYHTVRPALHNMKIQVLVLAGADRLTAVALRIRQCASYDQVLLLNSNNKLFKAFKIVSAMGLINFIGGSVKCVGAVHNHAPLKAGPCALPHKTLQFDLLIQIIQIFVNIVESIDSMAGELGCGGHKVLILRHKCHIVGIDQTLHGWAKDRMVYRIFQLFPLKIDGPIHLANTFYVLLTCHQWHNVTPLFEIKQKQRNLSRRLSSQNYTGLFQNV